MSLKATCRKNVPCMSKEASGAGVEQTMWDLGVNCEMGNCWSVLNRTIIKNPLHVYFSLLVTVLKRDWRRARAVVAGTPVRRLMKLSSGISRWFGPGRLWWLW